jgi:hypothetical protein
MFIRKKKDGSTLELAGSVMTKKQKREKKKKKLNF